MSNEQAPSLNSIYLTASSAEDRSRDKTDSLAKKMALQIVKAIRENLQNRLEGVNPLQINEIYLASQLAPFLDNENLGITCPNDSNERAGEESTELDEGNEIQQLSLDENEIPNQNRIKQFMHAVRKEIFALLTDDNEQNNLIRQSLQEAKFIYTRVKSNIQPVLHEKAFASVQNGQTVLVAGAESRHGLDPNLIPKSYNLSEEQKDKFKEGNYLAVGVVGELLGNEASSSMGKVVEQMFINMIGKETLKEKRTEIENYLDWMSAYSRYMALKNEHAFNPEGLEKDFGEQIRASQEIDKDILEQIYTQINTARTTGQSFISTNHLFTTHNCCIPTNGAAAAIFEPQANTKDGLNILAFTTKTNDQTIAHRFENEHQDQTIQQAYNKIKDQYNLEDDEAQKMLYCIHSAFAGLIPLFLDPVKKLSGDGPITQMKQFTELCQENPQRLIELGILPFGGLYGGHPSAATALTIIKDIFEYFRNHPKKEVLALIASVWGPLAGISMTLFKYYKKTEE